VRPDRRRRGLAGRLLDHAVRVARDDGAGRMLLEVSAANEAAVGFYAAHGFARIDVRRRYYRDGSDALVLARSLLEVAR
jgi:ribosomal protein S18 acetylase RimI-like enzyme